MRFGNEEPKVIGVDLSPEPTDHTSELAAESKPVEPDKPAPVVTKVSRHGKINRLANFRVEPNQGADIIDVLRAGSKVDILESVRDQYKVKYKDAIGYVKKLNVDEVR